MPNRGGETSRNERVKGKRNAVHKGFDGKTLNRRAIACAADHRVTNNSLMCRLIATSLHVSVQNKKAGQTARLLHHLIGVKTDQLAIALTRAVRRDTFRDAVFL